MSALVWIQSTANMLTEDFPDPVMPVTLSVDERPSSNRNPQLTG
jgi:hypothetical protein